MQSIDNNPTQRYSLDARVWVCEFFSLLLCSRDQIRLVRLILTVEKVHLQIRMTEETFGANVLFSSQPIEENECVSINWIGLFFSVSKKNAPIKPDVDHLCFKL